MIAPVRIAEQAAGAAWEVEGKERDGLQATKGKPAAVSLHPPPLREEELAQLWDGQRFPADALRTREGELLQVVYRGRRNGGAGPDFQDAIVADSRGRLLKGDIELHVSAGSFRDHGHHLDARYNRLILHVVFHDDINENTMLANGRRVAVVALAPWVARRSDQLRFWLARPSHAVEPCHDTVARLGKPAVETLLLRLGRMRFRQKQAAFRSALMRMGANQALYEGILRTLGHSRNSEAFTALATVLPYEQLHSVIVGEGGVRRGEALLLGTAGLLDRPYPDQPSYLRELAALWKRESAAPRLPPGVCVLAGLRPANHPARRLAGAVRLFAARGPSLAGSLRDLLDTQMPLPKLVWGWQVPADGFWRCWPAAASASQGNALIGRGRALELLVNVVLPFAAAWGAARGIRALSEQAGAIYQRLPRPGTYGLIAPLEESLCSGADPLRRSACLQQGMLYLHRQYCTQGGCAVCPLSEQRG